MRKVPAEIPRPDYAETGVPVSERASKNAGQIHVHTAEEIQRSKEACRVCLTFVDQPLNLFL